ncbi:MAG: YHS domain-containing protein, partial [Planctomycetaceae bacterium]|nr:YHS domain-containing protein [Planctomycetaceae bacterium]
PQKTYKLAFTQSGDEMGRRFVFNQQNNNRYLLEVYDRRAGNDQFFRVDTVSTQREGTSMALIDEGYGEKTCIISGGLGTISVSYQGNTYYVCCTGCKAAFDEDPERWIARFKENSN